MSERSQRQSKKEVDYSKFYKPFAKRKSAESETKKTPRSSAISSRSSTSSLKYEIVQPTVKRRKDNSSQSTESNAEKVVEGLEVLLNRAKGLKSIDDEILIRIVQMNQDYNRILKVAKLQLRLIENIEPFCEVYSDICFKDVDEKQLCDLVWAYQSLYNHLVSQHKVDKDNEPNFFKVLHWLERAVGEGKDEHMAKRWSQELFDGFWEQMVRAVGKK